MTIHPQRKISDLIHAAVSSAVESGDLPNIGSVSIAVEKPKQAEHGDFSTSVAMTLASSAKMSPRSIAERITSRFPRDPMVGRVSIAGPGFINFALSDDWLRYQVNAIIEAGSRFGSLDMGSGKRVQVEFVSVNPTGPLHIGHVRGAVIGNGIANVLDTAGYEVQREYYINDAGNQMRVYTESVYVRYLQAAGQDVELPTESYPGEFVVQLGKQLYEMLGDELVNADEEEALVKIAPLALEKSIEVIRDTLGRLGIEYDSWFSELGLFASGDWDAALERLQESGYLAEREGALWFLGSKLGLDSDSVMIRGQDRGPSYFGTDVAYHYNKLFVRKFDRIVDVWGADHHGHVARMHAVVEALGAPPESMTIIINQMVNLKESGATVRFSKRADNFVSADELLDVVGPDACHYIFMERTAKTHMEFDLELATRESSDNPVFYVQYAHARLCSVLEAAEDRGIDYADGDVQLLTHPQELALMRRLNELPDVVARAAEALEPHHLPHYAYEVARELQRFYEDCRVLSRDASDIELSKARLRLVAAARVVLANVLRVMSMSAPAKM